MSIFEQILHHTIRILQDKQGCHKCGDQSARYTLLGIVIDDQIPAEGSLCMCERCGYLMMTSLALDKLVVPAEDRLRRILKSSVGPSIERSQRRVRLSKWYSTPL